MRNRHMMALLAVLGGCDSSAAAKHPPFVISSTPGEGTIVPDPADHPLEVEVVLGDENVTDDLFVRFVIDYPATAPASAQLLLQLQLPPTGEVKRSGLRVRPQCNVIGLSPGLHRLTMSVTDRPFLDPAMGADVDPAAPLDSVSDDAIRLRAVWLLQCP